MSADECAPTHIAPPYFSPNGRLPRLLYARHPASFKIFDKQRERTIDDCGGIAVRDDVAKQISRLSQTRLANWRWKVLQEAEPPERQVPAFSNKKSRRTNARRLASLARTLGPQHP